MDFENSVNIADVISASSWKEGSEPSEVLIRSDDSTTSWSPSDDDSSPYVELRFPSPVKVTSLVTKGGDNGEFVPKFTLKTSPDYDEKPVDVTVSTMSPSGKIEEKQKVFVGNDDDVTPVKHVIDQPIIVAVIQIHPIRSEPEGPISLKIEIRGCLEESSTTVPAIVEITTVKGVISTTMVPPSEKSTTSPPGVASTPGGEMTTLMETSPIVVETTTTVTKVVTPEVEATTSSIPAEISTTTTTKEVATTTVESFTSSGSGVTTPEVDTIPSETTTEEAKLCDDAMGIEYGVSNVILQPILSASSNSDQADHARLNYVDEKGEAASWKPEDDDDAPWIAVTFQHPVIVTSVLMQGSGSSDQYVTEFTVEYTTKDNNELRPIVNERTSEPQLFNVNVRDFESVQISLPQKLESVQSIRIVPVAWVTSPAMRFEIKGCYLLVSTTTRTTTQSSMVVSTTSRSPAHTTAPPSAQTTTGFVAGATSAAAPSRSSTTHAMPTSSEITSSTINMLETTSGSLVSITSAQPQASTTSTGGAATTNVRSTTTVEGVSTTSPEGVSTTSSSGVSTTSLGSVSTTSSKSDSTTSPEDVSTSSSKGVSTTSSEGVSTTSPGSVSTTSSEGVSTTSPGSVSTRSSEGVSTTSPGSVSTTSPEGVSTTSPVGVGTTSSEDVSTTSLKGVNTTSPGSGVSTTSSEGVSSTSQEGVSSTSTAVVTTIVDKSVTTMRVTEGKTDVHCFFNVKTDAASVFFFMFDGNLDLTSELYDGARAVVSRFKTKPSVRMEILELEHQKLLNLHFLIKIRILSFN